MVLRADMQPNEALLLKCFDFATDGRARFAPHTAFEDPTAPADVPPRESIELRTLVFHPAEHRVNDANWSGACLAKGERRAPARAFERHTVTDQ